MPVHPGTRHIGPGPRLHRKCDENEGVCLSLPCPVSTASLPSTASTSHPAPKSFRQVIPLEEARPRLRVVPFRPGARPGCEALSPGQGCSLHIGLFDSRLAPERDSGALWLLYELHPGLGRHRVSGPLHVRMSVWLLPDSPEDGEALAVPGLLCWEVPLQRPSREGSSPTLRVEAPPADSPHGRYVAALPFAALRGGLARLGTAGTEAFSLAHLFHRRFRVALELCAGEAVLSRDEETVELYDLGRFGALYQRLLDGLVRRDAQVRAGRLGNRGLTVRHHPWYPVLTIGLDKARLYLEAIESDLARHTTHLPDPRWLVRVGLFLELLTALGIIEAVRPELPDLLSAEERRMLETAPGLAPVRARLDVAAWREVWEARHGSFLARCLGPVGVSNLLRKQRATLAFLETHHDDLERALELAGPALGGTRETWLRVFQDAERAVLRNADEVFPELRVLPAGWRQRVLWHEGGGALSRLVGNQEGVFAAASRRYRGSMNEVARVARERGWMDYTGEECVPREASLIEGLLEEGVRARKRPGPAPSREPAPWSLAEAA